MDPMSNDPSDKPNPFGPRGMNDPNYGYEMWQRDGSQMRLSVLSVLSLICSLLCVLSPLGVVLGVGALVSIQLSRGRKYGRGLAIAGIVIGLLLSSVLIGLMVGAVSIAQGYERNVMRPGSALVAALEKRDWLAVRSMLEPNAEAALSDQQLEAFAAAIAAQGGAFRGLDPQNWMSGFNFNAPGTLQFRDQMPLMLPASFERGNAVVILLVAPDEANAIVFSGRTAEKRIKNVLVAISGQSPVALSEEGLVLGSGPSPVPALPGATPPPAESKPAPEAKPAEAAPAVPPVPVPPGG
jgi:hypothetical protein